MVGLVCNAAGCPVAVEVFPGNTGDPTTLAPQLRKLRRPVSSATDGPAVGDRRACSPTRAFAPSCNPCQDSDWVSALPAPSPSRNS